MDTVNDPTFSVVIPAYNAARWLPEALAGVLAQTCQDFEIIVVDDGSTDDTAAVAWRFPGNLTYASKPNGGTASARNLGLRLARGRFIAFLDADDVWLSDKLERDLELFRHHPDLAWCYGDTLFFDAETGRVLFAQSQIQRQPQGDILRPLLLSDFIPVSTVVVKKAVFDQVGDFHTAWPTCEDWELFLRLARRYPVGYIPGARAKYRLHATQKTRTFDLDQDLRERLAVIAAAVAAGPSQLADLATLAASNQHTNVGWVWFQRGRPHEARKLFCQAITLRPSSLRAWVYWLASFVPGPLLDQMIAVLRALRKRA